MIKNKWNEKIEVLGRGSNSKMVKVIFHNDCREVYEVSKLSVKDGCLLNNRKTKSVQGIGYKDHDKNKPFKYNRKEYSLWKSLMNKFSKYGIQYNEYCSFVAFCKALRKHEQYNDILYNDSVIMSADIGANGEIKTGRRFNYTDYKVKRTNMRTGNVYYYTCLEELADFTGLSIDYLRKVINTDNTIKGCKFEYVEN